MADSLLQLCQVQYMYIHWNNSHKKRKESLSVSYDYVETKYLYTHWFLLNYLRP